LLQTHHPQHPLLEILLQGGYRAFAERELAQRAAASLPPFVPLALVRAEARQAEPPVRFLQCVKEALSAHSVDVAGPLPAPMPRRAGHVRSQLVISAPQRRLLHAALEAVMPTIYALPEARRVRWSLDVDPVDLN
jgi:primosomal protein N' (replication factor Y)